MTSRDFCYWLQGHFELDPDGTPKALTKEQTAKIQAHLAMVFAHEIDPSFPREQQARLDAIHNTATRPGTTMLDDLRRIFEQGLADRPGDPGQVLKC